MRNQTPVNTNVTVTLGSLVGVSLYIDSDNVVQTWITTPNGASAHPLPVEQYRQIARLFDHAANLNSPESACTL